VVRNACALSLVSGQPFRITNIRGGRQKPGLMRQHLTAVEAACAIGGAECDGLTVGASEMEFRPGHIRAGEHRFAVGTAGSTGLVLQTVLMPLLLADGPSRLILEGGTHNMLAPPFDFIERSFLPVINRMGPTVSARLVRHGFYPRGGGRIEVDIMPAQLRRIECVERGAALGCEGRVLITAIPGAVAEREVAAAQKALGWPEGSFAIRELPADQGPGNILMLEARFEHVTEIVSGFGQLGVSSESLARKAAARMNGYLESGAFAGPYLADQLLLPFSLAGGGCFTTVKPSQHALTAATVIERFTGRRTRFERQADGRELVTVD
jgi:RNA 3'-terminal phosphate cyclase (ATP)